MTEPVPVAPFPSVFGGVQQLRPDVFRVRLPLVNIFLIGAPGGDWVLVDTGMPGTAGLIRQAAAQVYGARAPQAIVLTHGHFDHIGALHTLLAEWNVPVYAHPDELPHLIGEVPYRFPDPTVGGLMSLTSPLFLPGPYDFRPQVQALPEDGTVPELPGWRWVHTPGHTEGHVSLWREADRLLIAGDAVVTTPQETVPGALASTPTVLRRPPAYYTPNWNATRDSVRTLAALRPALVATGHGHPLTGDSLGDALTRLADDFDHDPNGRPARGWYLSHPAPMQKPRPGEPDPMRTLCLGALGAAGALWLLGRRRR